MRRCLLNNCKKDISHRHPYTQFCNALCRNKYKSLKRSLLILTPEKLDAIRWAKMGASSSYEAMKSVYKLFKAQSNRHREV